MKISGVKATGIPCPIIRAGDNIKEIVCNQFESYLQDNTISKLCPIVIGITESVVARSNGLYVTVDDIADEIEHKFGKDCALILDRPIYSRNRFSLILKGIARAAKKIYMVAPEFDEVGNPFGVNPFTGVNIKNYYTQICDSEFCNIEFFNDRSEIDEDIPVIDCRLHILDAKETNKYITLQHICQYKSDWGLLGTNRSDDNTLKLFPSKELSNRLCKEIQVAIFEKFEILAIVCIYGDGCFKDPAGGIWEFADPVTMPGYTSSQTLNSCASEIKLKELVDNQLHDLDGKELNDAVLKQIAEKDNLYNNIKSQGTTPRIRKDLLASLMDLVSGSGDKGTPIVLIENYFCNYTNLIKNG